MRPCPFLALYLTLSGQQKGNHNHQMSSLTYFMVAFVILIVLSCFDGVGATWKQMTFEGYDSDRNALKSISPAFYDLYYDNLYPIPSLYPTILSSLSMAVTGSSPATSSAETDKGESTAIRDSGRYASNGQNPDKNRNGKGNTTMMKFGKFYNATLKPYGVLSARQSAYNAAILIPIDAESAQELGLATLRRNLREEKNPTRPAGNMPSRGNKSNEGNHIPWWCETSQTSHDEIHSGGYSSSLRAAATAIYQLLERSMIPHFFLPSPSWNTSLEDGDTQTPSGTESSGTLYNFSLVLLSHEVWNTSTVHDSNQDVNEMNLTGSLFFCVDCLRRAVSAYNALRNCNNPEGGEGKERESNLRSSFPYWCITSIFFRENTVGWCRHLPINDLFSVFFNSSEARSTFAMQPISLSAVKDWYRLWFSAKFNQQKWKNWNRGGSAISNILSGERVFPLFAIEYRPADRYVAQVSPPASMPFASTMPTSCFAWSTATVGVWLPSGGWTLWGRFVAAGPSATSGKGSQGNVVKKEDKDVHHVVLLVPSTTLDGFGMTQETNVSSSTFSNLRYSEGESGAENESFFSLGGADSPISGLVAALAIADSVRRLTLHALLTETILLDIFFLPAEWTGGVGSASLFQMIREKEESMLDKNNRKSGTSQKVGGRPEMVATAAENSSSDSPLFSVPVEVASADVVIALDQLAMSDGETPIFYHRNKKTNTENNTVLHEALDFLSHYNDQSITRVQEASTVDLPFSPISRYFDYFPRHAADSAAVLAFSRYDASFPNPHVFTPSDRPSDLVDAQGVAEAANVVLRLITKNMTHVVDNDFVHDAWSCLTKSTFSACSRMVDSTFPSCFLNSSTPDCSSGQPTEMNRGQEYFESEEIKLVRSASSVKRENEELLKASRLKSSNTFHPYLSSGEQILRKWMEAVGLEVVLLPALPPELEVTSPEAYCWRWNRKLHEIGSTTGFDKSLQRIKSNATSQGSELIVQGLSVFGSVIFSLSGGARVALVDPDPDVGWWMILISLVCCSLVLYFTWSIVL